MKIGDNIEIDIWMLIMIIENKDLNIIMNIELKKDLIGLMPHMQELQNIGIDG